MLAMRICMASSQSSSVLPLAGLCDQEVPENLHLFGGLQLLWIDEVDGQGRELGFAQHGHEVGFLFGQIVGNESDADAGSDRVFESNDVVGHKHGFARWPAVETGRFQPV